MVHLSSSSIDANSASSFSTIVDHAKWMACITSFLSRVLGCRTIVNQNVDSVSNSLQMRRTDARTNPTPVIKLSIWRDGTDEVPIENSMGTEQPALSILRIGFAPDNSVSCIVLVAGPDPATFVVGLEFRDGARDGGSRFRSRSFLHENMISRMGSCD